MHTKQTITNDYPCADLGSAGGGGGVLTLREYSKFLHLHIKINDNRPQSPPPNS